MSVAAASGNQSQHLTSTVIYKFAFDVLLPSNHRTRIADILSAYDDLIENNRRRIALLEQAARELYREWFVRLRFPGHENTRIVDGLSRTGGRRQFCGDIVNGYGKNLHQLGNGSDIPIIKIPEPRHAWDVLGRKVRTKASGT